VQDSLVCKEYGRLVDNLPANFILQKDILDVTYIYVFTGRGPQ